MQLPAHPLRVLFWEATLRCNAFCEFCGSRCGEVSSEGELTGEEICRVFREVADRYDASQIMIHVSGGEPLLRTDLEEIMSYAVSLGFRWGLVTNGTLLTQERVEKLAQCDLRTCSVSIDGIGALHDRIRSFPGSFQKITEGIRRLSTIPSMENIMVSTVVSPHNIDVLPEIRTWLQTMPVQSWRVMMVDPIGRADQNAELALSPAQVRQYIDFMKESRGMELPFSVETSCSHYLGREDWAVRGSPFTCISGRQLCSILANGDIFGCSNVPRVPELIQGNVRRDSLPDVWEQGFQWFRNPESRRTGKCRDCRYFPVCRGDSLHTWDFQRMEPKFCMRDMGLDAEQQQSQPGRDVPSATFQEVIAPFRGPDGRLIARRAQAQSLVRDRILLSPKAGGELFRWVHWGEEVPANEKEQAACLLGQIWRNREEPEEAFLVVVTRIEPLDIPEATEDTLPATPEWLQLGYRHARESGTTLLGFVHTHPGKLTIAMSAGDMQWHQFLYETDWRTACTLILNPQRKEAAAYTGPAASHTELNFLRLPDSSAAPASSPA